MLEMSNHTRNFFRLINAFDKVELPDGQKLHLYLDEDENWVVQIPRKPVVATILLMDSIALSVNIGIQNQDENRIIPVLVGSSDDDIKDIVYITLHEHLLVQ